MFRILDHYLTRQFLINLLVAIATWIIIFLVVDVIENISKFIDREATFNQVFMYYVYYIPYIISLTLPIAMLLSALFSMSTFAQYNEIIAQLSSGVSLYRILMPLFITAVIISISAGFFNELVVPVSNQKRYDIKRYDIYNKTRETEKARSNIYRQDTVNRKFIVKFFNGRTREARLVSIQTFAGPNLVERLDAKKMIWQEGNWKLEDIKLRRFDEEGERLYTLKDSVLKNTHIEPQDLVDIQKNPEEMSFSELNAFISDLRSLGADIKKWRVERHLKIAMPFANFIVVLLGAPLASRKRRGGIAINFGISLLVSFVYFIIIRMGQVFGHQGKLDPLLAAWLGNLIFLAIGIYALITVKK